MRFGIVLASITLGLLSILALPAHAAAQSAFVSGGVLYDIKRYSSGSAGPQVYDGEAGGGYLSAGAFVSKRLSAEFEMALSGETTTDVTTPVFISGSAVNFTTTFTTKLQTYSALFAVHTAPSARLHLSYRGGITFVHHRRTIIPPQILPANPESNTVPAPTTLTENVAAPTAGVDADFLFSPRLAMVAALRVHAFTVATDLSAFSIRPMAGLRVTF
jgi:hypothetical protein